MAPLIYHELRRLARSFMRRQKPGHTLQPTAFVNEAFVKLFRERGLDVADRAHFLALTYRDPDSFLGTLYQADVELVRVSKTTGTWARIVRFDSNVQGHTIPPVDGSDLRVSFDNRVKSSAVRFTHTFDFVNYTYAVYARLYRELPDTAPQLFQLRLQAATLVEPPTL